MRTFELGEIIAERRLTFEASAGGSRAVDVRIGRPILDASAPRPAWLCPFQVAGLGRDRVLGIFAVDALQALLLAVHTIPAELAGFMRDPGGRFVCAEGLEATFLSACRSTLEVVGEAFNRDVHSPIAAATPARFFLNVDLDIETEEELTPLLQAFEPHAYALERPAGRASFELNQPVSPTDPEQLILDFVRIVKTLPPAARAAWDGASRRVFDIGLQSRRHSAAETHHLQPEILREAAAVGAAIAVTVYPLLPEDDVR